jgi:hypothetical protein
LYWNQRQPEVSSSIFFFLFLGEEPQSDEDEQLARARSDEDEHLTRARSDEDEHLTRAHSEEDEHLTRAHSEEEEHLTKAQLEEDEHLTKAQLEEDEQLAKAIQESLNVESPPRYDSGNIFQPYPFLFPSGYRYIWSLRHL